jgi:pimeloyl-ACP methyl ester carboxylesterase
VFLPGFISNAYAALQLAEVISPARALMALDLRGRGGSDKPAGPYGIPQHVADVRAWIAAQGLGRIVLAGHSFGASLALFLAVELGEQVEKILLVDGGTTPSEMAYQMFWAYHQNLTYDYPTAEAYLAPYRQMPAMQPWTDYAEQLIRANLQILEDGRAQRNVPRHVVEGELAQIKFHSLQALEALYARITCPVLLLRAGWGSFGQDDQHINADVLADLQAKLPQMQVYTSPAAGHTSILTIPDPQRDQVLLEFLL